MLLETLDLRSNDILIYSQNFFNFNDSFKIIHKNAKVKRPRRISYFDVCNYVKAPSPKNLIIYRLLTNVNNLDAYSTKYGYFIKLNGRMELVYFDPIFAIKDLRHLRFELDPNYFRFKIQQVGLTSLTKWESEPDFAEVYSFDLKANEAQNQNDKIFADAIFAFDPNFIDEEESPQQKQDKKEIKISSKPEPGNEIAHPSNISEDRNTTGQNLNKPRAPEQAKASDLREEIISILKQALNIPETSKTENVKSSGQTPGSGKNKTIDRSDVKLFDLFKTTNKTEELSNREKENVILKFEERIKNI